jgi:ribose/xylose/arabinose/galactoside ABC-type transport system permease subunit
MWYLGPLRWPTIRIWAAAVGVLIVAILLSVLGVSSNLANVIFGVILVVVLVIAARNTLNRLGGPGALGKPDDR